MIESQRTGPQTRKVCRSKEEGRRPRRKPSQKTRRHRACSPRCRRDGRHQHGRTSTRKKDQKDWQKFKGDPGHQGQDCPRPRGRADPAQQGRERGGPAGGTGQIDLGCRGHEIGIEISYINLAPTVTFSLRLDLL